MNGKEVYWGTLTYNGSREKKRKPAPFPDQFSAQNGAARTMPRIARPRPDEPIRLLDGTRPPRYRVVLDVAPKHQPRKQITRTFTSLASAREFVAETREQIRTDTYLEPSKVLLSHLSAEWIASRRDIRARTVEGYADVLKLVHHKLGDRPVQTITRRDIEDLCTWLDTEAGARGTGVAQRSQVYALGALRQVLRYGVSVGLLRTNPAADVKVRRRTKDDHRHVTVWTPAQLVTFRTHADTDPYAAAWRLVVSGLRRSEVLGLRWSDVDLDAGTVRVSQGRVRLASGATVTDDPKSNASARVVSVETMHPGTVGLLRTLRTAQAADRLAAGPAWTDTGLVVVDPLGVGLGPSRFTTMWGAVCKAAKVPPVGMHSTRHALATMLHEHGVAPAAAARLLGHEVGTHLQFYVTSSDAAADQAAASLASVLRAASE
jgi:integrase